MRKVYLFVLLTLCISGAFTQALVNNVGANIYVTDGGYMIVKTNSLYNNPSGLINTQGTIVVEGYVKNDGNINGSGDTIRLEGDWINDSVYLGTNNSWVDMYGGNQYITGTMATPFFNLNLGGGEVVKRQTINASTSNSLRLNEAELATDSNEMLVTNFNPNAISWSNGFVSSVGPGKLSRATNNTSPYIFPMGSPSYINGPSIFRPIQMTPWTLGFDTFGVCLIKGDATQEGYNVDIFDTVLCKVNPHFWHRLYHDYGSDATALTMYFDPSTDGEWTDEAHWKAAQWNYFGPSVANTGLGFSTLTIDSMSDFIPNPFALARKKFTISAGQSVTISEGQSTALTPTVPPGFSVLWTPINNLSCADCPDPTASPTSPTEYVLEVVDPMGCKAFDSVFVNVINGQLLIPTAFSPNGDGVNDKFRCLNKNVIKMDLQVYNRWGEKVFETTDIHQGWDGTYKGLKQDMDVFVWQCTYQLVNESETKFAKGNVTLLR